MRPSHYTAMIQGCVLCGFTANWMMHPEYWLWALLGYALAYCFFALIGRNERKKEARMDADDAAWFELLQKKFKEGDNE